MTSFINAFSPPIMVFLEQSASTFPDSVYLEIKRLNYLLGKLYPRRNSSVLNKKIFYFLMKLFPIHQFQLEYLFVIENMNVMSSTYRFNQNVFKALEMNTAGRSNSLILGWNSLWLNLNCFYYFKYLAVTIALEHHQGPQEHQDILMP